MKRETENKIVACANIMIGITILLLEFIMKNFNRNLIKNMSVKPFTLYFQYEEKIVQVLLQIVPLVIIILIGIVNLYIIIRNRKSKLFAINYALLCILIMVWSFLGLSDYIFLVLFIVLGILALVQGIKRKNYNITKKYISIASIIIMGLCFAVVVFILTYPLINKVIYGHDKNEIIPDKIFVVQDTNDDVYINVERNNKYGYINQYGKIVIDFKYDFATPFMQVEDNGNKYSVAIVVEKEMTELIAKDGTKIAVYRSIVNENSGKWNELGSILAKNGFFGSPVGLYCDFFPNKPISLETYDGYISYPIKYPIIYKYTDTYDVVETIQDDDTTKYELVNKNNENDRITLDCEVLSMQLFSNGSIPFFSTSIGEQGWFSSDGTKHTIKVANVRILDVTENNILIKDYNKNCNYFINYSGNIISEDYKEIMFISEDRYIIQDENNKWFIINSSFQKLTNEYDSINSYWLSRIGLCICSDVQGTQTSPQSINFELVDLNGNKVGNGYFQSVFDTDNQTNNSSGGCFSFPTDDYDDLYTQE